MQNITLQFMRIILLTICGLWGSTAHAQINKIISIDSTFSKVSIAKSAEWVEDTDNVWFTQGIASSQFLRGFQDYNRNAFIYKQFEAPAILKFTVQTTTLSSHAFLLHLRNTEIDRVQLCIINDLGESWTSEIIGDAFPFAQRYFNYRTLAIPINLETNRTYTVYLGLDKKNRIISSIIELSSKRDWENEALTLNLVYGLSLGLFITFILIGIALFIIMRERMYLYYALYALFAFLTLFSVHGFSYQLLYPESTTVQRHFMLIVQFLALIFGNLYAFNFIRFQHHLKYLTPLKNIFISIYTLGVIHSIFISDFSPSLEEFLNYLFSGTQVVNCLFLAVFPVYYYLKFRVPEALVYLFSFLVVGLSVGYTNFSLLVPFLTYVPVGQSLIAGAAIEMFILTAYMITSYKSSENKRIIAESQVTQERLKNQYALIAGQEIEKRKIASDLHDNIGSSLVLFKRKLEQLKSNEPKLIENLKSELTTISKDIRNISHELLPVTLEELGFVAAVTDLISKYDQPAIRFSPLSPIPPLAKGLSIQIYRILQELIKNTILHGRAHNIFIQLFCDDEVLELTYEDDGIGFDKDKFRKGIGIKSMKTRVHLLKGNLTLESAPEQGLLVIVKVPLDNHGFGDVTHLS